MKPNFNDQSSRVQEPNDLERFEFNHSWWSKWKTKLVILEGKKSSKFEQPNYNL
ncbi:hypothetical protein SESBI_43651 [Sesbania bispinosa]|nr:hypothetical protein SESBI_43651 [Sesbania bispinosa]